MLKDFYYDYLLINLEDYGFGIDLEICKALFIVTLGVCIAMVMINYNKANMFTVIKQLIRHEVYGEDKAKTLRELGLSDKKGIRYALSHSGQLTRLVRRAGEVTPTYEEYIAEEKRKKEKTKALRKERAAALAEYNRLVKEAREQGLTPPERPELPCGCSGAERVNLDEARFYIPDETHDRCKHFFDTSSVSVTKTIVSVFSCIVVYVILVMLMPDILNYLSKLFVA